MGSRGDVGGSQPSCPGASHLASAVARGEDRQPLHNISNEHPPDVADYGQRRSKEQICKTGLWTDGNLTKAIEAVEEGMRIKTTSEVYKIPVSSLHDHLYDVIRGRKCGGQTILNPKEEGQIV